MSTKIEMKILGLDKLNKNLKEFSVKFPNEVRDIMLTVAKVDIESYAKTNPIPVDTGRLRASIYTKWVKEQQHLYTDGQGNNFNGTLEEKVDLNTILVGTNVNYAPKINRNGGGGENSSRTSGGLKRPKGYGKGFMDNAYLNGKQSLKKELAQLANRVEKI